MATTQSLIDRARLELNDQPSSFTFSWPSDGVTKLVELPYHPLSLASIVVKAGATTLATPADYTIDDRAGVLSLTVAQTLGTSVVVSGTRYRMFTDADWTTFINTALTQHVHNRLDELGYGITTATLPPIEDYLVASLAVVQALWAIATDASFDIDIHTPEGVSIPRSERFSQLMTMIGLRQAAYKDLCAQLNVGLGRIEMFNLRRVSTGTGRLVPLYIEREINDNRPPRQVFPVIDLLGASPVGTTEPPRVDLVVMSNQAFSRQLTGLGNLTGLTIKAHARPYVGSFSSLATMGVTVNDAVNGIVTVTLTGDQTWYLPASCFWDVESVDTATPPNVVTLTQGLLATIRQGQP